MGYVGNWISGHSGPAQKNKKAFSQKRKWVSGRSTTDDRPEERQVVGHYKLHHDDSTVSDWLMIFIVALLLGAGCWWAAGVTTNDSSLYDPTESQLASYSVAQQTIESKPEGFTAEQKHAYNFLVESGKKNLVLKDYRVASYEFNKALEIAPYGKEARLGLLEALTAYCVENNYYCDRVEPQLTFLKGMGWLK